ncbi:hypothetical protein [Streptomyces sp. NPDC001020]
MAATAKDLVDKAIKKREDQIRKRQQPHPDEVALFQVEASLALAQSNVELADAIKALTAAAGKSGGTVKDALAGLTAKLTDLAKR